MLTVGELQRWLNTYQAGYGLSPDAVVKVKVFYDDDACKVYPATAVTYDLLCEEANIFACGDDEEDASEPH